MNRTVFLDPRFQTDIAKLVSVAHVDTMSDPFSAQKYGIRALPADIVIDETGTIVARRTGECSFEQYRAFVSTYSTTASSSDPSPAASGVQNATVAASPRNVELFGLTWLADLGAAQRLASQKKRALIVWVYRYAFAPWNAFVEKTVEREEDALEMMTESLQEQLQDVFVVIHAGNQALPANQHFMSQNMHALYAGVSLFVRRPDGTSFEGISPAYNSVAELKRWFSEQVAPYESHSASPYGVPPGKSSETTSAGSGRVWAD